MVKGYPTLQRSINKLAKYNNYETSKKLVKWTGSTWVVSGSNVYNVPSLGSEILINGDMELDANWAALNAPATNERSSTQVHGGTYSRRIVNGSTGERGCTQTVAWSIGSWYLARCWMYKSAGSYAYVSATPFPVRTVTETATWTESILSGRATTTNHTVGLLASVSPGEVYFDDFSIKPVSLSSLFATVAGSGSAQTAAVKIASMTSGSQVGVVSLLNSSSSPSSFLIAYHDGTNVKLEKCVSGTYTTLITTAVAFTANATIEIRRPSGNTFQLFYNGVQCGTDQTVADTSIINNTLYGVFSTYSGNQLNTFTLGGVAYPFNF